jgi:hypothetical protein
MANIPQPYDEPMNVALYEARLLSVGLCADTRLFRNMRLVDSKFLFFKFHKNG